MNLNRRCAWLVLCLWAMPAWLRGQDQTPPAPAPQAPAAPPPATEQNPAPPPPAAGPPKPKHTPSTVDNGNDYSIEPLYWLTSGKPVLRRGDDNNNTLDTPGDLNFPGTLGRAPGAVVTIPLLKNDAIHVTYFQTQMTGSTVASENLNFFGQAATQGDPLAARLKISSYKASYEFLTYYWNRPSGDLRLKTLWELQYVSLDNTINDFVLQSDGTYLSNASGATKSIILPTFGLGLNQTIGQHLRWEAKGSAFGLPHRSILADGEADVAVRYGHFELIAGGRALHYRTTRKADHYDAGTLWGPYVGVRLYWSKK